MFEKIIWQFDMIIYSLFYWRWEKHLSRRRDIRKLFITYLNNWEAISDEPCMGIGEGGFPKLKKPIYQKRKHEY